VTPDAIMQLGFGVWGSKTLLSAVELGVFSELAGADVAAVAFGIAFPAVFFVLAATGVLENEAAFTAAKWTGFGLIGLYGFAGARLSGAGVLVSVMQAVGVALIGALLIALKALVH
jgi:hypothetical protein